MRYGELKKALVNITPKMLTTQLRDLESEGLIHRKVYPEVPPKVEYSITEYGMTLKPIWKRCMSGAYHTLRKNREWGNLEFSLAL